MAEKQLIEPDKDEGHCPFCGHADTLHYSFGVDKTGHIFYYTGQLFCTFKSCQCKSEFNANGKRILIKEAHDPIGLEK